MRCILSIISIESFQRARQSVQLMVRDAVNALIAAAHRLGAYARGGGNCWELNGFGSRSRGLKPAPVIVPNVRDVTGGACSQPSCGQGSTRRLTTRRGTVC